MLHFKALVGLGLLSISINTFSLWSKNVKAGESVTKAPVGKYICIDQLFRPMGIEFEVLQEGERYKNSQGSGKILYLSTNDKVEIPIQFTGALSQWNESIFVNSKQPSIHLLGKNDNRNKVVPTCHLKSHWRW